MPRLLARTSSAPGAPLRSGVVRRLALLQAELAGCRACAGVVGPVVHGPPLASRVFLLGQAPGAHEGELGRPFAWTAGRTLFRWFEEALGLSEEAFRAQVYMAAVLRCFPGKAKGGGDRRPSADEIARCRPFVAGEVGILRPRLVLPVGALAIEEVLGHRGPLAQVVGALHRTRYHGVAVDVVPLPHPSGASTWHRSEPGKTLLTKALGEIARHPEIRRLGRGAARSSPRAGAGRTA